MAVWLPWAICGSLSLMAADGRRGRARNNYILVVLDSCRYDSFYALGRKSCASWVRSSGGGRMPHGLHPPTTILLMGLMPHVSPREVFASDYYKRDFLKFNERLGSEGLEFKRFVPRLYLPVLLQSLGYRTNALVSLPVLNPFTILNTGFDRYKLMDRHNDMRAMFRDMTFPEEQPSFYLLNVGETHYPYALPGEPEEEWPRIGGVHGVFKHLDDEIVGGKLAPDVAGKCSTIPNFACCGSGRLTR